MKHYFKVSPDSPAMEGVLAIEAAMTARAKGMERFLKGHGISAREMWGDSRTILGVVGDKMTEPGWRYDSRNGFNKPDLKTTDGREIRKQLLAIPAAPDLCSISSRVFGHKTIFSSIDGRPCIVFATFAKSERGVICRMDSEVLKAIKLPAGMTEITASEAQEIVPEN